MKYLTASVRIILLTKIVLFSRGSIEPENHIQIYRLEEMNVATYIIQPSKNIYNPACFRITTKASDSNECVVLSTHNIVAVRAILPRMMNERKWNTIPCWEISARQKKSTVGRLIITGAPPDRVVPNMVQSRVTATSKSRIYLSSKWRGRRGGYFRRRDAYYGKRRSVNGVYTGADSSTTLRKLLQLW